MGAKTHMWMPQGVRSVFGCVLGRSDLSQWFSVRVKVFKAELRVVNSGPSVVRSMEHGSYKGHSDLHRAGPKPPRTLRFECSIQEREGVTLRCPCSSGVKAHPNPDLGPTKAWGELS